MWPCLAVFRFLLIWRALIHQKKPKQGFVWACWGGLLTVLNFLFGVHASSGLKSSLTSIPFVWFISHTCSDPTPSLSSTLFVNPGPNAPADLASDVATQPGPDATAVSGEC